MQSLQDITLLAPLKGDKGHLKRLRNGAKTLREATSITALYHAAANPLQTVGRLQNAVEEWTDGRTKEQRQEMVDSNAQKTLRSMQQRHVSKPNLTQILTNTARLEILRNGNQHRKS